MNEIEFSLIGMLSFRFTEDWRVRLRTYFRLKLQKIWRTISSPFNHIKFELVIHVRKKELVPNIKQKSTLLDKPNLSTAEIISLLNEKQKFETQHTLNTNPNLAGLISLETFRNVYGIGSEYRAIQDNFYDIVSGEDCDEDEEDDYKEEDFVDDSY